MLSRCYLARFILWSWRRRQYVPPKRRLTFNGLHRVNSQKILFITTAVRPSNPAKWIPKRAPRGGRGGETIQEMCTKLEEAWGLSVGQQAECGRRGRWTPWKYYRNIWLNWRRPLNTINSAWHFSNRTDSVVGIATGYGLGDREVGVRVPVGSWIFYSPQVKTVSWAQPTSYPMCTGSFFPGGKAEGEWSWSFTYN
jgi:hypothetical protein